MKLKTLDLENICGFRRAHFDFNDSLNMFYGANGSGKCLSGEEIIVTEDGAKKIKDVFLDLDLIPQKWYDRSFKIAVNGEFKNVKKIFYNGKSQTIKIKTKRGYSLEGSKDRHQVLAIRNGNIEFIKLNDLKIDDFVCLSRKSIFPEKCSLTESQASIFGYLIAEGYLKETYRFFNSDPEILQHFIDLCYKNEDFSVGINRLPTKCISLKSLGTKLIKSLGLQEGLSGDKEIPQQILLGTKDVVCSFLRAYFEGDGGISAGIVGCWSKSEKLIKQIQLMLLRLGILSTINTKIQKLNYTYKYPDGYLSWRLELSGQDILLFAEHIGFISTRKKNALNEQIQKLIKVARNPNYDIIPSELFSKLVPTFRKAIDSLPERAGRSRYFSRDDYRDTSNGLHCLQDNYLRTVKNGISCEKLQNCVSTISKAQKKSLNLEDDFDWLKQNYFFDRISSIKEGYAELFDICVEDVHCFWSSGFIRHNSSILDIINIFCSPQRFQGRDVSMLFRKLMFHNDYNPSYGFFGDFDGFSPARAIFEETINDVIKKYTVELELDSNRIKLINILSKDPELGRDTEKLAKYEKLVKETGIVYSDLPKDKSIAFYADADNPANLTKFQIDTEVADQFLDIAHAIYGYKCIFDPGKDNENIVREYNTQTKKTVDFLTDFIIIKEDDGEGYEPVQVHYRRMSAGERKITTLIKQLLSPLQKDFHDLYLIDNVDLHIYHSRQPAMIDKLLEHFPEKQFFMTAHSAVLIGYNNIPGHIKKENLFDVIKIRQEGAKLPKLS